MGLTNNPLDDQDDLRPSNNPGGMVVLIILIICTIGFFLK